MSRAGRARLAWVLALVLACALTGCGSAMATRPARPTGQRPSSPPARSVVGLGDSVMVGTHCHCSGPVAEYAEYAEAMQACSGHRVRGIQLGTNGATTRDLIRLLSRAPARRHVRDARVVLVIVGANDLLPQARRRRNSDCPASCYRPAVRAMGVRLRAILARVARIRAGRPGRVLVADYWNVFLGGRVGRRVEGETMLRWSRSVTRAANRAIRRAARSGHAGWVDLYRPFFGRDNDPTRLLAPDGDHPNARGVAVMVRQLARATPAGTFS
ncbi:MAG: SGNH/GDSL hydrolase family protein [Marmoricola sp.]